MKYVPLTIGELAAIDLVLNGNKLGYNHEFKNAMKKLRFCTGMRIYGALPEHEFACTYDLKWFKQNREAAIFLKDSYQAAAIQYSISEFTAEQEFWKCRVEYI